LNLGRRAQADRSGCPSISMGNSPEDVPATVGAAGRPRGWEMRRSRRKVTRRAPVSPVDPPSKPVRSARAAVPQSRPAALRVHVPYDKIRKELRVVPDGSVAAFVSILFGHGPDTRDSARGRSRPILLVGVKDPRDRASI